MSLLVWKSWPIVHSPAILHVSHLIGSPGLLQASFFGNILDENSVLVTPRIRDFLHLIILHGYIPFTGCYARLMSGWSLDSRR